MIHRINIFILSLIISIFPTFTFAMFGGWSVGTPSYEGAGSFYYPANKPVTLNGQPINKQSGFRVSVNPARVAKVLAGGVGAVALAEAVTMLIGAGVDWVLDPANNRVRYTVDAPTDPDDPTVTYIYTVASGVGRHTTPRAACSSIPYWSYVSHTTTGSSYGYGSCTVEHADGDRKNFPLMRSANPAYDPSAPEQDRERSIPLTTVAAQVISNADSHADADKRAAALAVVGSAAQDMIDEAENDASKRRPFENQLENNAVRDTSETATGSVAGSQTGTESGTGEAAPPADIALEFPKFCGWAPVVCEAAQVAITFPSVIEGYVSDFWDYVSDTPTPDRTTKVDIIEVPQPEINSDYFVWNSYCPFSTETTTIELGGYKSTFDSDLTSWCDMASEIRPFVVMAGALASFLIAAGVVGRSDE